MQKYTLVCIHISGMAEVKEKRYEQVAKAGAEISRLVDENQKYFQALEGTETWQAYLEFIDKIVMNSNENMSISCFINNASCTVALERNSNIMYITK